MNSIGSGNAADHCAAKPARCSEDALRANDEIARAGGTILQVQSAGSYSNVVPAEITRRVRDLLTLSQQLQQRAQASLSQSRVKHLPLLVHPMRSHTLGPPSESLSHRLR